MTIYVASSGSVGALPAAVQWVSDTLFGPLGTGVAVIAVAALGLEMLSGRIAVRRAGMVIVGCFIFFGAPIIARGLLGHVRTSAAIGPDESIAIPPPPKTPATASANPFDPYSAGPGPN